MVDDPPARQSLAQLVRRHPVIGAIFVLCTLGGALLGALYLPEEWSSARRLAGGALAGAGIAVFLTVTRLFAVLE